MACSVEVENWPRHRREERDVRDLFCGFGDVRSVKMRHGPRDLVLVRYACADSVRAAMRVLQGARPAGCDDPLALRVGCDECATLQSEVDALRAQLAAHRASQPPIRRGPPPRPVQAPPPKRRRSESPTRSESEGHHQPDSPGASTATVFLRNVHDRLGERAAHHLSNVLPPRVMTAVVTTCARALVYPGNHWMVPDRRSFVNEMRHAITAPGVLSMFFDWSGFRIVMFVDDAQVDRADIAAILNTPSFVTRFGEFEANSYSEVLLS